MWPAPKRSSSMFVVLTAALSSLNAGLYSTGRVLRSMAEVGSAPRFTRRVSRHGVPYGGIALTAVVALVGAGLNAWVPADAFEIRRQPLRLRHDHSLGDDRTVSSSADVLGAQGQAEALIVPDEGGALQQLRHLAVPCVRRRLDGLWPPRGNVDGRSTVRRAHSRADRRMVPVPQSD